MLAYGHQTYTWDILKIIFLSILTLYCGFFAALIWNDITDADIDRIAHPSRPVPQGKITARRFFAIALVFSVLTFLFALLTSLWCFIIVGFNALFVAFHDKYLKKRVKIPAYSEIFTPVQWLIVPLFGYFALWTVLPPTGDITITVPVLGYLSIHSNQLLPLLLLLLFTYFADDAHDLAEGIHDVEGDRRAGVRTYATSFGEKTAATISVVMILLAGIFGIMLYLWTTLTLLYLVPFVLLWLYTLFLFSRLMKAEGDERKQLGKILGRKGFNFLLFTYALIFLDVFVQMITLTYFHWMLP